MNEYIKIKNARIHNLKGIDVEIPKNKLTVITGISGSGKSSLAFDTLYEEGKRRYLMFSGTQFMIDSAPMFDRISGLSPTVAVEQRIIRQSNPRSTVGTRTKISNMLAMLFATAGERDNKYDDGQPLSVEMFQRNSPKGMCVKCLGTGIVKRLDEEKLFADMSLKIEDVALGLGKRGSTKKMLDSFYKYHNLLPTQKLATLTAEQLFYLQYGDNGKSAFMGFVPWITHITNGAFSISGRLEDLLTDAGYMSRCSCPKCSGTGLGEQASHTLIMGKTVAELEKLYIKDLCIFLSNAAFRQTPLLAEILAKLNCMVDVGLHHLALSRPVPTLSGGEIQRLFLASYIIAEMDSIIFIFDEPTIGLHAVEKAQLIQILKNLVDRGNTVITVEHDETFMRSADYIIDLGPNAGIYGGERIFQGSFDEFLRCSHSNTAPYLSSDSLFTIKRTYKPINAQKILRIENACLHNLQNVSASIPLGLLVGVAGVSGSGKSSLIADTLVPKLKEILNTKCVMDEEDDETAYEVDTVAISGTEYIKKCLVIDQKPIGRSRTSCPATYTGMFDRIRTLFAKASGLPAGLFTVNSQGGCKLCKGDGELHYHVGFGNFINLECEACGGTGFVPAALEVIVDGKTIRDVLSLTVDEAAAFFKDKDKPIENMLTTLLRVGMGYITLGQKTPTISGGESQRIKLAKELAKGQNAKDTVYILDEPTTGLAFHDSLRLMELMQELVDKGNTVIVTEHDPYVLSNCDYLIEMGIGGGSEGGNIIATGNPSELRTNNNSIIGRYLK
ncbi:hypothetical protein [Sporomusa sp.]|uniref:hypothetical protein n=1 Tax=Sporomusa sp. TaxID=2078658 RepID=UPI002CF93B77|nr:hypothetical protein [Sporomusa sp.]HWR06686.1 hypothetical protein [Sporomusa sp.]